jgi:hypothetical protein
MTFGGMCLRMGMPNDDFDWDRADVRPERVLIGRQRHKNETRSSSTSYVERGVVGISAFHDTSLICFVTSEVD